MAYAPNNFKPVGSFIEKDHGNVFEYSENPDMILSPLAHGGKNVRFPHIVWVGPLQERRYAFVKGTCVHIITDETPEGHWVVEKWNTKKHRNYSK